MIALKLLKILRDDYIHGELDEDINEAISELEEVMKHKTCEGCKHSWEPNNQTFHRYFCNYLKIPIPGNFYCYRYEPKDNA